MFSRLKKAYRVLTGKPKIARLKNPEENALLKFLSSGQCPDCGGREFYMGPQGGLCQNITCGNDNCGSRFNVAPFSDGVWGEVPFLAQRLSEPSPKKPKENTDTPRLIGKEEYEGLGFGSPSGGSGGRWWK